MKKIVFSLGCLLLIFSVSYAQSNQRKQNAVGISVGWQQLNFFDQHASPLIYKAKTFPNVGLYYNHQTEHSILTVKLSGGIGTANPQQFGKRDYGVKWSDTSGFQYQVSSQFIHANIEATYLRKLSSLSSGKLDYWVGGTINEQAYYADEVANFPWIMNTVDIGPAFQMNYNLNATHNFGIKIDFASLGVVSRSVYSLFAKSNKDKNVPAFFKQGTRVATIDKYQRVNVEFFYKYYASKRIGLGANYRVKWMHYSYPKPVSTIDSRFNFNIEYLFY